MLRIHLETRHTRESLLFLWRGVLMYGQRMDVGEVSPVKLQYRMNGWAN
jgi:hypothetical protein